MNIRILAAGAALAALGCFVAPGSAMAMTPPSAELALAGFDGLAGDGHDGAGVTVAVVDSGVDLDHPTLKDHLGPGIDLVDGDDRPDDDNGHGTHVAGIVLSGAPGATIMPVRVLDASGSGSLDTIAEGVRWAADHGADVINISIGDSGALDRARKSTELGAAIREVADRSVVVAAAGNDDQFERVFRAGVPAVVALAVDDSGAPAPFSNVGGATAVAAPGVDVVSTAPVSPTTLFPNGTDGSAVLSGTSMAAPFVAAEAALLIQSGASPTDAFGLVQETARNSSADPRLGQGIIDAGAAVQQATQFAEVTAATSETPAPPADDDSATDQQQEPVDRPTGVVVIAVAVIALGAVLVAVLHRRRQRDRALDSTV